MSHVMSTCQDDPQVVLAAVKSVGSALQYASVALRSHSTFVRAAILADGSAMQYALGSWAAGSSQNATVTMAVSRSRLAYGHAPNELQEAEDVAAKAVQHGLSFDCTKSMDFEVKYHSSPKQTTTATHQRGHQTEAKRRGVSCCSRSW